MKIKLAYFVFTLLFLFSSNVAPVLAATSYLYDQNGNMTSDGQKCFVYNDTNQLKQVKSCSDSKVIAEYVYDYQGTRLVKKEFENGILKRTVYSPTDEYETVKLANGTTQNTVYYKVNDETVAKQNPDGTKQYFHNDHLGSVTVLTNQSGTKVEETSYDPWGEVTTGGTQSKYLFTGQEKDLETGLNYYGARYYNSHIKHFTQPDDIIQDIYDPQSLNRYSYVRNNPVKYTDPTGHIIQAVALAGSEFALGGAEIYGFTSGFINSSNTTFVGRLKSGIVGAQYAIEDVGQFALPAIAILSGMHAENPVSFSKNSNTGNVISELKNSSLKGSQNPITNAAAAYGREMHANQVYPKGFKKEVTIGNIRLDAANKYTNPKIFIELKPNTTSGKNKGNQQIIKYENYLFKTYNEIWRGILWTYSSQSKK